MATINCPHGSRWISQRNNITWEFRDVQIFNDVCDHSDCCGIERCQYFDNTQEGTQNFIKGLYHSHTLEGIFADKQYQDELHQKHKNSSNGRF